MGHPWVTCGVSVGYLWGTPYGTHGGSVVPHGAAVGYPLVTRGLPHGVRTPWFTHGSPIGCRWCPIGDPWVTHEMQTKRQKINPYKNQITSIVGLISSSGRTISRCTVSYDCCDNFAHVLIVSFRSCVCPNDNCRQFDVLVCFFMLLVSLYIS